MTQISVLEPKVSQLSNGVCPKSKQVSSSECIATSCRILLVKYFSDKVAVVYGVASPIATCICLKLIQQGAKVILMEQEQTDSAASLSRDLNLLCGGIDTNDHDGGEFWRAKPIVTHLCVTSHYFWML